MLWALQGTGLDLYFKGGTSLSKAFGLIRRFSEDVDITIDRGTCTDLPELSGNFEADGATKVAMRKNFFEGLLPVLDIPGLDVVLKAPDDGRWKSPEYQVRYPISTAVADPMKQYVLIEPGVRRWKPPTVPCDLSSFVHDFYVGTNGGMGTYADNRAKNMPSVHPFVTFCEKLDALNRRYSRPDFDAAGIIRHYEDLANIVDGFDELPELQDADREMIVAKTFRTGIVDSDLDAIRLGEDKRREELEGAHAKLQPWYWGERQSLDECCQKIRQWLAEEGPLGGRGPARA